MTLFLGKIEVNLQKEHEESDYRIVKQRQDEMEMGSRQQPA